ncbi:hypothetical protein L198_04845 [Cryptococcus wingfieldii CBS 7118]|uniref:Uncharacterized protein n=1 Tax=Cryptococcus wingfieldii CBS 7118 TaxID=1295528 RepID=A0A1E3J1J7_9TREE|nr:hypothetical protein L198_04845 [Cryptococcus wingfieldii CBS 7118]ODN94704.1 hypothetical protein L198_04845 [Cryptococcus wingfieldii CBS 7118]
MFDVVSWTALSSDATPLQPRNVPKIEFTDHLCERSYPMAFLLSLMVGQEAPTKGFEDPERVGGKVDLCRETIKLSRKWDVSPLLMRSVLIELAGQPPQGKIQPLDVLILVSCAGMDNVAALLLRSLRPSSFDNTTADRYPYSLRLDRIPAAAWGMIGMRFIYGLSGAAEGYRGPVDLGQEEKYALGFIKRVARYDESMASYEE